MADDRAGRTPDTVGYVLKGYPRISELFIASEIWRLEQLGLRLRLFVLKPADESAHHPVVDRIDATASYLPETTSLSGVGARQWLRDNVASFRPALGRVARRHGGAIGFLHMAIDVARHHHERYDGGGYPDGLAGDHIPLAARIVAVADVYDALRSPRPYKPAMTHAEAVRVMADDHGHFDPALFDTFREHCADEFERLYAKLTD